MEVATSEERTLKVLIAVNRVGAWGGAAAKEVAASLTGMGRPELAAQATLYRLMSEARKAGLLTFGPIFGWRAWSLTEAGRKAIRLGRLPRA